MRWILLLLACCNSAQNTTPADKKANGATGPTSNTSVAVQYALSEVTGCSENPGVQTVIAKKGSGFALVTLAQLNTTTACVHPGRPTTQTPNVQICYAESNGTGVTASQVASVPQIGSVGLGFAVASNGQVSIGYPGGADADQRCGGSDMVISSGMPGAFTQQTILAGSAAGAVQADQTTDCLSICAAGDATGFWPALAYSGNSLLVAFRDLHYGVDDNSRGSTDVEFSRGGTVTTIDGAHGGGLDNRIAVDAAGKVSVAYRNHDGQLVNQGIWVLREGAAGFVHTQVTTRTAGEQIGFAINSAGVHGLAFYDVDGKKLVYVQSNDGLTWDEAVDVDTDGIVGQYPTLAFDDSGEPAIAYYRCDDYPGQGGNCNTAKDGLIIARRSGGTWTPQRLTNESSSFEGKYPALVFVGGKAVVAYRQETLDPSSGKTTAQLMIAKEP